MIVATRGIYEEITEGNLTHNEIIDSIQKFNRQEWGELCEDDCQVQKDYIKEWGMLKSPYIMGVYRSQKGLKYWVGSTMSESGYGRDITVLLPEEY